jgi:hypothetical protein
MDYPVNSSWIKTPGILFTQSKLREFFPSNDMSYVEKINAITRFVIYASILLCVVRKDVNMLLIPVFCMTVIYFLIKWGETLPELSEHFNNGKRTTERQTPTINNPFMNVIPGDKSDRKEAISDTICAQKDINEKFDFNLYKNTNDVFGTENSNRQFYTMPNTANPNKQTEFATWLYGQPERCKEDTSRCGHL